MAITLDIIIALSIDKGDATHTITLQNTNPRFTKREIKIDTQNEKEPVTIDASTLGRLSCFHSNI
jgi:hypothetical protein